MKACGDSGGRTKTGEPCGSTLGLSGANGLCLAHDPERVQQQRAMAKEGGRAARAKDLKARAEERAARAELAKLEMPEGPPQDLEGAVRWSSWAIHAVATGAIDARTGHEIGYLVNAFRGAAEKRDLEKELEKARASLELLRRGRAGVA